MGKTRSTKAKSSGQDLKSAATKELKLPDLPYAPPETRRFNPPIGIIGCGGISEWHCKAYKAAGYNVVALCDLIEDRAVARQKEFFPRAKVYTNYKELLARKDIQVVDIPTHPQDREYLIPAALKARKHVLSQKPFVLNLDKGKEFAALAKKQGVTLAVNQNGRWAPYFSYMRQAVKQGLIGETTAVHLSCHWDHNWIKETHFDRVHHIILYDFAIHWFDMLNCLMNGKQARRVTATLRRSPTQTATPPLLGQALVEYDDAQATVSFDGDTHGPGLETVFVTGTRGYLEAHGGVCGIERVTVATSDGTATTPALDGKWFPTGFHGSMAELLQSIEQKREPANNPLNNLQGLAMCFAAVNSAEEGRTIEVAKVKTVPLARCRVAPATRPEQATAAVDYC